MVSFSRQSTTTHVDGDRSRWIALLAVLATVSASRADGLIDDGESAAVALTSGYHVAFWIGAGLVMTAIVVAVSVLRSETRTTEHVAEEQELVYSEAS